MIWLVVVLILGASGWYILSGEKKNKKKIPWKLFRDQLTDLVEGKLEQLECKYRFFGRCFVRLYFRRIEAGSAMDD